MMGLMMMPVVALSLSHSFSLLLSLSSNLSLLSVYLSVGLSVCLFVRVCGCLLCFFFRPSVSPCLFVSLSESQEIVKVARAVSRRRNMGM